MKCYATIILKTKEYVIHSDSLTIDGLGIASPPYYRLPIETSFENTFEAVKDALNNTKYSLPRQTREELSSNWYIKTLKFKSLYELYKDAKLCGLELNNDVLNIKPGKKLGVTKGFIFSSKLNVVIPISSSIDEIEKAFSEAFDRCE